MSRDYRQGRRDDYYERDRRPRAHDHTREVKQEDHSESFQEPKPQKELPNFEVSGVLAEDQNQFNGVALHFSIPPDSASAESSSGSWRVYEFKGEESGMVMKLDGKCSCFLIGSDSDLGDISNENDDISSVILSDSSISRQHAVIQFRRRPAGILPYLMDLDSTNGTFLNDSRISPGRYIELRNNDIIRFGRGSCDYVVLHA